MRSKTRGPVVSEREDLFMGGVELPGGYVRRPAVSDDILNAEDVYQEDIERL